MANADFFVRAPVNACARSESSGSMADTSRTAASRPSAPNTGAPEQLRFMCRDLKCWVLWMVIGRSSTMHVPMPFVPSTSSDHTPPSQVPQYSKDRACASSPRCSTATPELSQNKTTYPASRTTLYNCSMSSWALKISLSSGSREYFSSPDVRMRGALLATGSTPYLVADRCHELDISSAPDKGAAPSATEQTCSACPAKVTSESE